MCLCVCLCVCVCVEKNNLSRNQKLSKRKIYSLLYRIVYISVCVCVSFCRFLNYSSELMVFGQIILITIIPITQTLLSLMFLLQKSVITAVWPDFLSPSNVSTNLLQFTLRGFHLKSVDYLIKSDQRKNPKQKHPSQLCLLFPECHLGSFKFFMNSSIQEFMIW